MVLCNNAVVAVVLGMLALLQPVRAQELARMVADEPAPHETPATGPWVKVSALSPAPGDAPPATAGIDGACGVVERDGFVSVQVNVDLLGRNIVGDAANEPSIAIDPADPRRMVIGWRQFDSALSDFRQAGYGFSHDGGTSWTFPGSLTPGVFGSDPVLDADADGVFYYLSINFEEMRLFKSFDGGVTWSPPIQALPGFHDKPWMIVTDVETADGYVVFISSSGTNGFGRSFDSGASFQGLPVSFSGVPTLAAGSDGRLYAAGGRSQPVGLFRSANAFDETAVPEFERLRRMLPGGVGLLGFPYNPIGLFGQPWVAAARVENAPDDTVYLLSTVRRVEDSADVMFARSDDSGVTWSPARRVNNDAEGNGAMQWFGMMSVAPNGRIDAVWIDTRNNLGVPDSNLGELYYAFSNDGGDTWPINISVSPVFDSHIGWPGGNMKLGDYYHMRSDNLGVNIAYAATFNGEQDIYFLRIGPHDCNGNDVSDEAEIFIGASQDANLNGVLDECETFGDFNGDSRLDLRDFQGMQLCFGAATADQPGPRCTRLDLDLDNHVDLDDYRAYDLLANP